MLNERQAPSPAAALLEFQQKLQRCKSQRELVFVAANESLAVLRFDQAVIWYYDARSQVSIAAVSGLAEAAEETPYAQWLHRAIDYIRITGKSAPVSAIAYQDLPESLAEDGRDWVHEHLLHCALHGPDGTALGGMLFNRAEPFDDIESAVAEWTAGSVGFALWGWRRDSRKLQKLLQRRSLKYIVAGTVAVLAILAFVPVRLSAVAPAEITPVKPIPIASPVDGVVGRILVQPNQVVKADEPLVELDDTSIRNKLAVARKALDIARADYQRAMNKSFTDEASKSELLVLDSKAREKAAEVAYLTELLDRLRILAPQGGVAIFSDSEDWRGRPVQPGERIMVVADPSLVGVTVYLPPEDAVQLDAGGDVTVFLNIDPLSPLKARITQTSYEATVQPDNTLAYVVKGEFDPGYGLPRIGLRGTAKVYGERVALGYYLLRKPILFLRKSLGV
jgi:multidrug resistance efflux pump